jgi:hypothetical protein
MSPAISAAHAGTIVDIVVGTTIAAERIAARPTATAILEFIIGYGRYFCSHKMVWLVVVGQQRLI